MSGKLDQSLDEILAARKASGGARGGRRGTRRVASKVGTTAPSGGVQKKREVKKPGAKPTTNGKTGQRAVAGNDTKIIVSNLPRDVDEKQIQDYFSQSVGTVKKVWLQYGPTGQSQGRATILFNKAGDANKALQVNNGVVVDGKPMKIEIIVDATRAAAGPEPKSLSDRITNKTGTSKPKSAAPKKDKTGEKNGEATRNGKTAGAKGRGAKKGRVAGRPKRKTADQLDAEMTDYFAGEAATNGEGEQAPAADADTGMDVVS